MGAVNQSPASFLKNFIDLTFFLCVCPFRIKSSRYKNANEKWDFVFVARSFWLHKIGCAILSSLGLIWLTRRAWDEMPSLQNASRPGIYFEVVWGAVDILQTAVILKFFWFDQHNLLRILNFLISEESGLARVNEADFFSRVAVSCLFFPYVLISILGFMSGRGLEFTSVNYPRWSVFSWWNSVQCTSRDIYLFQRITDDSNDCRENPFQDTIFAIIGAIGQFYRLSTSPDEFKKGNCFLLIIYTLQEHLLILGRSPGAYRGDNLMVMRALLFPCCKKYYSAAKAEREKS